MIYFLSFIVLIIVVCGLYVLIKWKALKAAITGNCLVWQHPENSPHGIVTLNLKKVENPPGPAYPFHSFFFLPNKLVWWCYEVKVKDQWQLVPFLPDDHVDFAGQTTGQLAFKLDWRPAKRILRQKAKLMEKVAQGGIIILGCASLFGIMMLLDMLNKPV